MKKFNLPYFGQIDSSNLKEYYDVEIEFNERNVELDLNFSIKKIDISRLENVKFILNNLKTFDRKNRIFIEKDFNNYSNGSMAYDYLSFHLEELGYEFEKIIDKNEKEIKNLKELMNALKLKRVGFYPDEDDETVIFDYCLNDEVSDELLVIIMKKQQKISITWES